jgi:hypothetical protein
MALWSNPDKSRYRIVDRLGPTASDVEIRFIIQKRWWRWWFDRADVRVLDLRSFKPELRYDDFLKDEGAVADAARLLFEAYLRKVNYRPTVLDSR